MAKSDQINHQGNVIPSAPPVPSSLHHQGYIHKAPYADPNQDVQHKEGIINSGFQSVSHHEPGFMTHPNEPANPPPVNHIYQERPDTYCRRLHTNRRQTASISGGLLLMLVSGLHIGWGVWRTRYWPLQTNSSLLIFSIMAWSFGAIFGGFIGSALTPLIRKHIIYYVTAVIMTIGNLLYIIWDENYAAIVIGRLITSLAHGIVFVALITQAGENSAKNMRGTVLSTINCIVYTAIFISIHVHGSVPLNAQGIAVNITSERIIGIMALIFILASIICTITLTVETVPYLLTKNKPNVAKEHLKHLRGVAIETPQITSEMEELTLMISQDKKENANIFTNGNGKSLVLIVMIRLMTALTNNFLLNYVVINFCEEIIYNRRYAPLILIAPRLAISIGQIFYADFFRRKVQIIVSTSLAGLTMIGLGVVINVLTITPYLNYYIPAILCIWFQLFCGIGIDQMADVFLSEAFSTAKKPWSLSFVMGIEHSFHIFMIGMAFTNLESVARLSALIFITGILIISFGIILVFTLPETRGTTLKRARDLFQNDDILTINIGSLYA